MYTSEYLDKTQWNNPDDYAGHSPDGHYCVAHLTRDSDLLTESNWHEMLKLVVAANNGTDVEFCDRDNEPSGNQPYIFRAGHWACGWVEYLIIPSNALDGILSAVSDALESLDQYPVLNEDDLSERESNAASDYWENCHVKERVEILQRVQNEHISLFAARHDEFPQDDCGSIHDICLGY